MSNKFGADTSGGWNSQLEKGVHGVLLMREKAREITEIKCQQTVYLTEAKIAFKMDFTAVERKTGLLFWIEAKGVEMERWKICKKLWPYYGPACLEIWKGSKLRPFRSEVIIPDKVLDVPDCIRGMKRYV